MLLKDPLYQRLQDQFFQSCKKQEVLVSIWSDWRPTLYPPSTEDTIIATL